MSEGKQGGIVYVLENPAMPGLVKIGKTSQSSVSRRLNDLYSTGVPVPFECIFAGRVEDESVVESAFHEAFGPNRINPNREFFEIESYQATALLRLIAVEDVTPAVQKEAGSIDAESQAGARKLRSRRPNLNFDVMGIPVSSKLKFTRGDNEVEIIGHNRVKYGDDEYSLTGITKQLLGVDGAPRDAQFPIGRMMARVFWTFMMRHTANLSDSEGAIHRPTSRFKQEA